MDLIRQLLYLVAVGAPVAQRPRTDPHVQDSYMRLLRQILGVEAQVGYGTDLDIIRLLSLG